ncbi:MAG: 3-deoxy-7-phosphoheptulonate synthase [Candidatus Ratteibacteria bacterium]|jgi:3-deoxy-7-phosphoheptulonate synthase
MADLIIMDGRAPEEALQTIINKIESLGYEIHLSKGKEKTLVGIIGDTRALTEDLFVGMEGVIEVISILKDYKLVTREFHPEDTIISIGDLAINSERITIIAGPCSVENLTMMVHTATQLKKAGCHLLRGGAFKPRTSPYSFFGLGKEGLSILHEAKKVSGMPIVTEVLSPEEVEEVAEVADILQIGTRNMYNYRLLERVGKQARPVLLKRGFQATLNEFLSCAEYIMKEGNEKIILCERGIRTFDSHFTRNCLDLSAVPVLKKESHLPVFIDPSHGTGRRDLVLPMSKAAIAAGADGLLIEVHPKPDQAISDGFQSLTIEQFNELMKELSRFAEAAGRSL